MVILLNLFLKNMTEIKDLTKKIIEFRDERNWKQFHNPKDVAISLSVEAAEVLEHFKWKSNEEIEKYIKTNKKEIGKELADVLNHILILAHDLDIDIVKATKEKTKENHRKYPIEKNRGEVCKVG